MTVGEFAADVRSNLSYQPNGQQELLIGALARFCSVAGDGVFILNGYAGTGKTSLMGALVRSLRSAGREVVLLAPTGRAAKVLSGQAAMPAYTIHRRIYRGDGGGGWTEGFRALQHNALTSGVFIVDEASMIGDASAEGEGGQSLLDDLVEYVFTGDNSRLIVIGDVAQLPPVGAAASPAMQPETYKRMGLRVSRAVLTETVRQARESGILRNATWLRRAMLADPLPPARVTVDGYDDVALTDGNDVADVVGECYRRDGADETIVVTRSNRRAREFNLGIRQRIMDYDELLVKGERLLVAKNNYMWSARVKGLDFIANGDVAVVQDIRGVEERYGFRFANVRLWLPDSDAEVDCKIFLDTLTDEGASISVEAMRSLAEARMADPEVNPPDVPYTTRLSRLRRDEYFNALQVKYAYAMTCHKAQGGQWMNVVVDMGGIAREGQGMEFYRWLYTATTRATRRVFFLNAEEFVE